MKKKLFKEELYDEDPNLSSHMVNALRGRGNKGSEKIPTRRRRERDYCGATFHVSEHNFGRKPREKDHRN